jgi:hypothetical protein
VLDAWLETALQKKYSEDFGTNGEHYATSIGLEILADSLNLKPEKDILKAQ